MSDSYKEKEIRIHAEGGHVEREAEIAVMQTREHQGAWTATRSQDRGKIFQEEATSLIPILDVWPPDP